MDPPMQKMSLESFIYRLHREPTKRIDPNCLLCAVFLGNIKSVNYLLKSEKHDVDLVCCPEYHGGRRESTSLMTAIEPTESLRTHTFHEYGFRYLLYSPKHTIAMIETLCKENEDLTNRCDGYGRNALQRAMSYQSLEVIKKLLELGAQVNHKDNDNNNSLHEAASYTRVNTIQYLLNETDCDIWAINDLGYLPCAIFMERIAIKVPPSAVHFEFGLDFISRSHKTPLAESFQVRLILNEKCFLHSVHKENKPFLPIIKLEFQKIVKFAFVNDPRIQLMDKMLATEVENILSLILLLFLKNYEQDINRHIRNKRARKEEKMKFEESKYCFLIELFALFLKDEPLANEYLAEIAKMGYRFCASGLIYKLYLSTASDIPVEILCNFGKMLLRYGFDFLGTGRPGTLSMSRMCQHVKMSDDRWSGLLFDTMTLWIPEEEHNELDTERDDLSMSGNDSNTENYDVNIEDVKGNLCVKAAFNESENWLLDYYNFFKEQYAEPQVISLKNLSRLALRRHAFLNYNSQDALTFLNSFNVPKSIQAFLCFY